MHPGQNGGFITVEDIKKLIPFYRYIDFCGQVSDPIFNPHLIDILKEISKHDMYSRIITAATSKKHKREWYKEAFEAHPGAEWTFGIDGLPEESCMYRINQDGEFLFDMMVMGAEMGMNVRWQYIPFSYNEHNIEEAYNLAKEHGIKFELYVSARYEDDNDVYKPKDPNLYRMRPEEWQTLENR